MVGFCCGWLVVEVVCSQFFEVDLYVVGCVNVWMGVGVCGCFDGGVDGACGEGLCVGVDEVQFVVFGEYGCVCDGVWRYVSF